MQLYGQRQDTTSISNQQLDVSYIKEIEEKKEPAKVLHAEPLYIDLIRDLGARKGEKEWNVGMGIVDNLDYDTYEVLVEYEWAPVDRLGLEIEVPFTLAAAHKNGREAVPSSAMEGLKTALQWTFLVSERSNVSLALGYINELEFSSFGNFGSPLFKGNIYNPFFVAAKRWGNNYHTLIYTGPQIEQHFKKGSWNTHYDFNTNFHYMISGTRNFIGLELNKSFYKNDFDMTIRPQMRLAIADNFMIGIVGGIPVKRENQRFSSFARIIWEPRHH